MTSVLESQVSAAVRRLVADGHVPSSISARIDSVVGAVCVDTEHAPSVSPEDEGAALYWVAMNMAITVIVYADTYWWSVRDVAGLTYMGSGAELAIDAVRASLRDMSDEISLRCLLASRFPGV